MKSRWSSDAEKGSSAIPRASEDDDPFHVLDFPVLDFPIFRFVIDVGKKASNRAQARPAMRVGHHSIGIKAVFHRPLGPNSVDRGSRIDEDAVKIKQDGATPNCG
jgi:hypothetical protein